MSTSRDSPSVTPRTEAHRPSNSFVIFQFGEGSTDNFIFDLPPLDTPDEPQTSSTPPVGASQAPSSSSTPPSAREQRSMLVSVSYVYSQTAGLRGLDGTRRSGTIMLNVPNVPHHETEAQMNRMIEFAASIALGAVAAFTHNRMGIPKPVFDQFSIRDKDTLTDLSCPICYEVYDEETKPVLNESGKRVREDDKEGDEKEMSERALRYRRRELKRARLEAHASSSASSSAGSSEEACKYDHLPIELPCGHVFGRSCAHEWLKSSSTCPLCRTVVHESSSQGPPETINLPNIGSFFDPAMRDRPIMVMLDRTTNTLVTTPHDPSIPITSSNLIRPPSIAPSRSSPSAEPVGIPRRDTASTQALRSLARGASSSLFPSGVSSTRTPSGIETRTSDFQSEARRLLTRRIALNTRESGADLLGFNDRGEVFRLNSALFGDGDGQSRDEEHSHDSNNDDTH